MATNVDPERVFRIATDNRLMAAEIFASLTHEQWRTPSLCSGWTVQEVAAHLLTPIGTGLSVPKLLFNLVRYRASLERTVDEDTRKATTRTTEQLVTGLREHASKKPAPPAVGALGPMTDTCIHLRDAARPLGVNVGPAPDAWRPALDFLVSKEAVRGFLPRGRLDGLRLIASDQDWAHGDGAQLCGPSETVAMAASGRSVALDLSGRGIDILRERITCS